VLDSKKRQRLLARAQHLDLDGEDTRAPEQAVADALKPLVWATFVSSTCLFVLASLSPRYMSGFGSELLAGFPATLHLVLGLVALLGARRVCMVFACATSGLLLFATGGAFGEFERLFAPGRGVVLYPLFCFAIGACHLAIGHGAWKRLHADVARAEAREAARNEL
jgi:hypothetical protein